MSITYGFYDSISSDRLYNARQMSNIFDGLILDGVYYTQGNKFMVFEDTGMNVSVGSGRAWFDHTWTYNDAAVGKTIATADALLNRIDVIYLEVNENVGVRANSIGVLTGTPATDPDPPILTNTGSIHQYALAHIYVGAAVTEIVQGNITNKVGTEVTPWVQLVTEEEFNLQTQIWAIVGDENPPLIALKALKTHSHQGSATPQIESAGIATGAVLTGKLDNEAVIASKIGPQAVTTAKIQNNAVITAKINDDAVDDTKVGDRVPQVYRRQGGSATDWDFPGSTNRTPTAVRIQCGAIAWNGAAAAYGDVEVTFPVAFSYCPIVMVTLDSDGALSEREVVASIWQESNRTTKVKIAWEDPSGGTHSNLTFQWVAIGPE